MPYGKGVALTLKDFCSVDKCTSIETYGVGQDEQRGFLMQSRQARPFAVQLYYEWCGGKTIDELARETSIPKDRIAQRIRVAQTLLEHLRKADDQH